MSGPSRYQPSRRSRFRARGPGGFQAEETAGPDHAASGDDASAPGGYEPALSMPETDVAIPETVAAPAAWLGEEYIPPSYTPAHEVPSAEPAAKLTLPSVPVETGNDLPRVFQLRNVYEGPAPQHRSLIVFYLVLGGLILLGVGSVTGYLFGARGRVARTVVLPGIAALPGKAAEPAPLSSEVLDSINAAFEATKQRRYGEAQKMFGALHAAHPEWPSMAIESARADLYQSKGEEAGFILSSLARYGVQPDAEFLKALLHLTRQEYDAADHAFEVAVALDPTRAEYFYFWGECLRDEGKPREAAEKFRAALLRNQYETAEGLYQLKYWICEIQADQEEASGANNKIDLALAVTPRPPYSAVFAAAARSLKAGKYEEAAKFFAQGQMLTEPVVFRVIIQDPTFVQESWRPQLAGFYK